MELLAHVALGAAVVVALREPRRFAHRLSDRQRRDSDARSRALMAGCWLT
jgi:hypothetical protein